MFCPNCGANLADGSAFCGNCGKPLAGNPVNTAATNTSNASEQFAEVTPYVPEMPINPVKKGEFIKTLATSKIRMFSLVALILTVVYAAVMIGGYFFTMNSDLFDVPVIAAVVDASGIDTDEIDDFRDQADDYVDQLEVILEENEDELSSKEEEAVEAAIDVLDTFDESFSIAKINEFYSKFKEFADSDIAEEADIPEEMEELSDGIGAVLNGVTYAILGSMIFAAIFAVLGGFFKKRGLVITGLIFSIIHTSIFCGTLFVVAVIILCAVLIYLLSVINSEYKKYCRGEVTY